MSHLSSKLKERFVEEIIPFGLLDEVVTWISEELAPEEVFFGEQLEEWARDNGFVKAE
jgi:hypothetical protein